MCRTSIVPHARKCFYALLDVVDPFDGSTYGREKRTRYGSQSDRVGGVCADGRGTLSRRKKIPRRSYRTTFRTFKEE